MQFRKEDKRSIFPENFVNIDGVRGAEKAETTGGFAREDILSEIEFLNAKIISNGAHVLSKNSSLRDFRADEASADGRMGLEEGASRNNISDLVKMGHRLPEVKSIEKMLSSDDMANETSPEGAPSAEASNLGIAPYRIVNLISGSYKLPDIDDESFFR